MSFNAFDKSCYNIGRKISSMCLMRSKQGEKKDVFNQKYFEIMRNPTPHLLLSYCSACCGDHQIILQKCQTSRVSGSHPQWPPVPASFLIKSFHLVEKPIMQFLSVGKCHDVIMLRLTKYLFLQQMVETDRYWDSNQVIT